MADILRNGRPLEDVLVATGNPGLHVLPAGTTTPTERPALAHSPDLEKVLVDVSDEFDHVLFDLPAIHFTSEALTLAEHCGTIALVVGQGVTPETQVKSALDAVSGLAVMGVILNRNFTKIPRLIRKRIPGA
jgi:Mrp family chromosome partitioning ATPase